MNVLRYTMPGQTLQKNLVTNLILNDCIYFNNISTCNLSVRKKNILHILNFFSSIFSLVCWFFFLQIMFSGSRKSCIFILSFFFFLSQTLDIKLLKSDLRLLGNCFTETDIKKDFGNESDSQWQHFKIL